MKFIDILEGVVESIDSILNTTRKRHILGGVLLSVSTLFGGLAITVITIRKDEETEDE